MALPLRSSRILFVAVGAAADPEASPVTEVDGYFMGLAKRSFTFS